MVGRWALPVLLTTMLVDWVAGACSDSGFTTGLACSNCEQLEKFNLGFLSAECNSCCEKDNAEAALVRFSSATLKVCG